MGSAAPPTIASPVRQPAFAGVRVSAEPLAVVALPLIAENPYQHLLYGELVGHGILLDQTVELKFFSLWRSRRRRPVLHFHWPQNYYSWWRRPARLRPLLSWVKLVVFVGRLASAKWFGYRIAWTIHEVAPHEQRGRRVDQFGSRILAAFTDVFIALDGGTASRASEQLHIARDRILVIPHGSYLGVYPAGRSREEVRRVLGIPDDSFALLCFGHIRAYKEIDSLLRAFALAKMGGARLVVAGLPMDDQSCAAIVEAARKDARIVPVLEFVPDERVAELFGACDAAVQPRADGGTSGALILALSLGLPVVTSALPDYEELIGGDEAGWTYEPRSLQSLAQALERAAQDPAAVRRKAQRARDRAETLTWPQIAVRTATALRGAV